MNRLTASSIVILLLGVAIIYLPGTFGFRDALPGRQSEANLPQISVEERRVIYCRMRADDFRFPLPPNSSAHDPTLTGGGFDTVEGSVVARFHGRPMTGYEYEAWISDRLQPGGSVSAETLANSRTPADLLIRFSYFGDR